MPVARKTQAEFDHALLETLVNVESQLSHFHLTLRGGKAVAQNCLTLVANARAALQAKMLEREAGVQ